jgi:hypothetical protein
LNLEWHNVTAAIRDEFRVESDVTSAGLDAFVFRLGKQLPLSCMRSPRGAGMLINFLADCGDSFEPRDMTVSSVSWLTLLPEVSQTLFKHRNKINF